MQLKKLEAVNAIKSLGLRLGKPKGRRPRIIVKDHPGSMEDNTFPYRTYSFISSEYQGRIKIERKRLFIINQNRQAP